MPANLKWSLSSSKCQGRVPARDALKGFIFKKELSGWIKY
jgi:hypothetical protein